MLRIVSACAPPCPDSYDKDHISVEIIKKIRPYVDNPEFQPEKVCRGCFLWFTTVSWWWENT